jgi:hypothetical protein
VSFRLLCDIRHEPFQLNFVLGSKYSIELFRNGGEGPGIEKILVRHDSLTVARVLYKVAALNCSERLIMLCDRARVLARSDRPETMPAIR